MILRKLLSPLCEPSYKVAVLREQRENPQRRQKAQWVSASLAANNTVQRNRKPIRMRGVRQYFG